MDNYDPYQQLHKVLLLSLFEGGTLQSGEFLHQHDSSKGGEEGRDAKEGMRGCPMAKKMSGLVFEGGKWGQLVEVIGKFF